MPTGSTLSEFAEFSREDLVLPEAMRTELSRPLGRLVKGAEVVAAVKGAKPLVTVGDYTTADLVERGGLPQIGAVVAYGQPDEGAVIVRVDRAAKERVRDILRRMVA